MSRENVEIVRRAYDAWNRGDMSELPRLLDPDFCWQEASEVPGRGSARTRDEFERYLTSLRRHWEEFHFEPEEFEHGADTVLAVVTERGRGKASGVVVEQRFVHVWRLRGGKALRLEGFFDKDAALEAAGLVT